MWFLEAGKTIFYVTERIKKYKEDTGFKKEFHFSQMRKKDLPIYKDMVELFLQEAPAISFKFASLPTSGIQDKQGALNDLFYHLIVRGVEHENNTGRAVLPRNMQIWKDAEEEGSDRLFVADLDDRLKQISKLRFSGELNIQFFRCADTAHNLLLQVADLLSASATRILNQAQVNRNHKTEFAEFFLEKMGIDKAFSPNEKMGDDFIHISL